MYLQQQSNDYKVVYYKILIQPLSIHDQTVIKLTAMHFKDFRLRYNYVVLYCIDGVVIAAANALRPFQDLLCSPEFRYD